MSSPTVLAPRAIHFPMAGLQVVGLAATSHWLFFAVQYAPGFAQSQLASATLGMTSATGTRELVAAFLQQALFPGLLEEILFRGVLFAILLRLHGTGFAVLASALVFGIFHLDPHHAAVATLLGLQLGLLRAAHGLLLCAVAHVTNNFLALISARFASESASHFDPIGAPVATPWVFIALAISLLSCAFLVQAVRKRSTPGVQSRSGL